MSANYGPQIGTVYEPREPKTLDGYKRWKIKLLSRDFCVNLSEPELGRINSMPNKIQVDNCCQSILLHRL